MNILKKLFAITLAIALLLTVAGCGGNGKGNTDSDGFVKESTIKLPDLKIDSDKVYYLTWDDPSNLTNPSAYIYTINEKLKQEYGVSIEYVRTINTEIEIKAAQLVLSGNSPDLIAMRERDYPNFVLKGIAQPWDDYMDFSEPVFKDVKDVNDKYRINGKVYRYFNTYVNNACTWYWVNDFKELGLKTPRELYYDGEWTWSKLEEYAKLLTVKDSTGTVAKYGVGYEYDMHVVTGETYVKRNSDGSYSNNLSSSKLADWFNYSSRLGFEEKVRPVGTHTWDLFKQGKVSMLVYEQNYGGNNMQSELLAGDVDFAPSPKWDNADKYYAPAKGFGTWLAKGAKNPEEAVAYMAIWRLCSGKIDPVVIEAQNKRDEILVGWDEEDHALYDEMNDSSKFELVMTMDDGMGTTWGSTDRITFQKDVFWHNQSWASAVQEYNPLLNSAINEHEKSMSDFLKK